MSCMVWDGRTLIPFESQTRLRVLSTSAISGLYCISSVNMALAAALSLWDVPETSSDGLRRYKELAKVS